MKTWIRRIWKPIFLLSPMALGMLGFYEAGESFLQALYKCIGLYGMNYSDDPANIWLEVARWLAPLATASSIVMIVTVFRRHFRCFLARFTGKSVAVYGDGPEKAQLLKELGLRGIDMGSTAEKAHTYILMGTEEKNLSFYWENPQLQKTDVYLKCSNLPAQASYHAKLHLFCPEETAARFFWKRYCPYEICAQNGYQMDIVLLGFGKLGREILISGLQNNIFHPNQQIRYHIFGRDDGFTKTYRQLSQISDPVIFHPEPWQDSLELVEKAQLVLVVQQEKQLQMLTDLTLVLSRKAVHVMVSQDDGAALMARQYPLICYDWERETLQLENIIGTRLHAYAKRINLRYAHLYEGVEETDEEKEMQWQALNTFTRYSNISAADYHDVRRKMMGGQPLTEQELELLAELEHIRWCRYHFLNNWQYGQPENGKAKDPEKRIHRCLVAYEQLSEQDKEKDRENIRILLALDKENQEESR